MKSKVISFLIFSFGYFMINAQNNALAKKWDYRFGGTGNDAVTTFIQTIDGGYILGGESSSGISGDKTQSSQGGYDYWVVKIDTNGMKQWDRRFGGSSEDGITSIQQTFDGGYILGGTSSSNNNGDKTQTSQGGNDYWIVKIDQLGNKQWDKRYGGGMDDELFALRQTIDQGYLLGGFSSSLISGDKTEDNWDTSGLTDDFWIIKVDSLGNKQWDKRFGGTGEDGLTSLQQSSDGGYILGGLSSSDSSGDKSQSGRGGSDYWIVKIDSVGNKQWDMRYGGISTDEFCCIQRTVDENYILGGYSLSGIGGDKTQATWINSSDFWIIKVDSGGNKLWDKDYGGTNLDQFTTFGLTNDGGYLLSGWSNSPASGDKSENNLGNFQTWIVKTDSLGNKEWDKTILTSGNDGYGYAIQAKDGCYIISSQAIGGIGGYKTQPNWDPTNTTYDYWIVKFCDTLISGVGPSLTLPKGERTVIVSPNPFTSDIAIAVEKDGLKEANFTITNTLGQIVFTRKEDNLGSSYTKMLDLSYLANGLYILEVVVDGEITTKQIVKSGP